MIRHRSFLAGTFAGLLMATLLLLLAIRFLPNLLVTSHALHAADAIVVLGGDRDGSRLRKGLQLHDEQFGKNLILVAGGSRKSWESVARRLCPDCTLEGRGAIYLDGSTDTRTDAQLTRAHCQANDLTSLLIVTSPYHTRRSQFVFNDILEGSGITATVISSGEYGRLLTPEDSWWRDRATLETVWLEFGKILYWELTPFLEFQEI